MLEIRRGVVLFAASHEPGAAKRALRALAGSGAGSTSTEALGGAKGGACGAAAGGATPLSSLDLSLKGAFNNLYL